MPSKRPSWIVPSLLALSAMYSIYLGFRVSSLERELAALRLDSGAAARLRRDQGESSPAAPGERSPQPPASLEARLDTVEDDLAHMQEEYAKLDEQLAGGEPGAPAEENRILDVVTRAQARVRDRQLEFHGAQWKKARSAMLADFAEKNELETWQVEHLQHILDEELDEAVTLLARPESAENPELVASEWQRRLDETDAEALRVLEGTEAEAWMGARLFERQLLWPWLPSLQPRAAN